MRKEKTKIYLLENDFTIFRICNTLCCTKLVISLQNLIFIALNKWMEIKYQFYQTEIYSELSELELADEV